MGGGGGGGSSSRCLSPHPTGSSRSRCRSRCHTSAQCSKQEQHTTPAKYTQLDSRHLHSRVISPTPTPYPHFTLNILYHSYLFIYLLKYSLVAAANWLFSDTDGRIVEKIKEELRAGGQGGGILFTYSTCIFSPSLFQTCCTYVLYFYNQIIKNENLPESNCHCKKKKKKKSPSNKSEPNQYKHNQL